MNYSALIQNRKSVRAFSDRQVPYAVLTQLQDYYRDSVRRLVPGLETQLYFFSTDTRAALEGAAGYNQFLIGAPQYMVLLSEKSPLAGLNAGYMMEDLILKLTDLDIDSCWLTFTDSDEIKEALGIESSLEVAAIAAFGYGVKMRRQLRVNILSMSNVDIKAKRHYFEPKIGIRDLVSLDTWGNTQGLEDRIGFLGDILWEAFYAATLSPSYLNRQAYGFLLRDGELLLVSRPDAYNTELDGQLSLGIVLLHFSAVAQDYIGALRWNLGDNAAEASLPEGFRVIASTTI